MYFSSLGGNFLKAQMLNNYEKTRCELHKGEIARRRIQSLTTINKSIKDVQDTLRDIRASSGYCREMQKSSPVLRSNVWQVREGRAQTAPMSIEKVDISKTQAGVKVQENTMATYSQRDVMKKDLDCSEHGPVRNRQLSASTDRVERSFRLSDLVSQRNVSNKPESSLLGKNALNSDSPGTVLEDNKVWNYKTNGDKDIEASGDDRHMQPSKKSPNRVIKGTNKSFDSGVNKTNSDFNKSQFQQRKRNRSPSVNLDENTFSSGTADNTTQGKPSQRPGSKPYKPILQSQMALGTLADELPNKRESDVMIGKSDKSGVDSWADEFTGGSNQTAAKSSSRGKSQVKSAPVSQRRADFIAKSARALSTGDIRNLKIHTSISKTERKRILQELISNSTVTYDRSILERVRQRVLQEKIARFFELLHEQDGNDQSKDENNIFWDD